MKVWLQTHIAPHLSLKSVLVCSGAYFIVTLVIAAYFGAFSQVGLVPEIRLRERNSSIGLPLLSAYAIVCNYYLLIRGQACLLEFLRRNHLIRREKWVVNKLLTRSWINTKISIFIGLLLGFVYLFSEGLLPTNLHPLIVFLNIISIPFWILSLLLVLQLISFTHFVIKYFFDREKIGIFGNKKLLPISDFVISNTVIAVFYIALIPVFWIGTSIPVIDMAYISAGILSVAWFLCRPVIKLHRNITWQKQQTLERINHSIFNIFDNLQHNKRRLTDDPQRLRRLSALVALKQEVNSVSEWPIDLPQSLKGIFVAISIPMSWALGSLVETYISNIM